MSAGARTWLYRQLNPPAVGESRSSVLNRLIAVVIIAAVVTSVVATEPTIADRAPRLFVAVEFAFGLIFLVEYVGRIWVAAELSGDDPDWVKRIRYAMKPIALVDLFVVVVSLSPVLVADVTVLRLLRLLRLAALAKFGRFSRALNDVGGAIFRRRYELLVTVALAAVLMLFGAAALYMAEGEQQPEAFGSILRALWWSIVTLTTVGYGDIAPVTPLGKSLAGLVAISGVGLVAMPAGILAAAFSEMMQQWRETDAGEVH